MPYEGLIDLLGPPVPSNSAASFLPPEDILGPGLLLKFNNTKEILAIEPDSPGARDLFKGRDVPNLRLQKFRLKGSRLVTPHMVVTLPQVLPYPPAGWPYEDDIIYDPKKKQQTPELCKRIRKTILVSMAEVEDLARTAIDIVTFPIPFIDPPIVDVAPFQRLKGFLLIIASTIGELREVKRGGGQDLQRKCPDLMQVLVKVRQIRKISAQFSKTCDRFEDLNRAEYTEWGHTARQLSTLHYHKSEEAGFRVYSGLVPASLHLNVNTFEILTQYGGEVLDMSWSPNHFRVGPDQSDFLTLPTNSQMALIREVAEFAGFLLDGAKGMLEASMDLWRKDARSYSIHHTCDEIRSLVDKMLHQERYDTRFYLPLKLTLQVCTARKLDLLKTSHALNIEARDLLGRVKDLEQFVTETYYGPGILESLTPCYPHRHLGMDDLFVPLAGKGPRLLEMSMPLTPKLTTLFGGGPSGGEKKEELGLEIVGDTKKTWTEGHGGVTGWH